jgi:hypothetical protein
VAVCHSHANSQRQQRSSWGRNHGSRNLNFNFITRSESRPAGDVDDVITVWAANNKDLSVFGGNLSELIVGTVLEVRDDHRCNAGNCDGFIFERLLGAGRWNNQE